MNRLQVLSGAEPPQIDECVCHQFHGVVPTLLVLKPQQQPLEFVFPGKHSLHSVPYVMDRLVEQPFTTALGTLTVAPVFFDIWE